jgi:hypothetical protein
MPEPVVFISRNKIREGKAEEFRKHYRGSIPPVLATRTDTLAQLAYENEESTEITIVRLFPNAQAFDVQIQGADERSKKTYEYIEPISIEIFGTPSSATLEQVKHIAGFGVVVKISPIYTGGFIR